jgi:hypothetical protein
MPAPNQPADINPFLDAEGLSEMPRRRLSSIDNFIDAHRDDERVKLCGKLGIALAILKAERHSKLFLNQYHRDSLNHHGLGDTWYSRFFQLLTQNVANDKIEDIFKNIAFITFNYDRCIEQFLFYSLQTYYAIPEANAPSRPTRRPITGRPVRRDRTG